MASITSLRTRITVERGIAANRWHRSALVVSGLLALTAFGAAAATFFIPDVLRGPAVMNGSARGTALVMLVLGIPVLLVAMFFAARGSLRASIVWLGAAAYFVYNGVMFVLGTPTNQLYLLYEALLGLAVWSAALVVASIDRDALIRDVYVSFTSRAIAAYALFIVTANALLWLATVVPGVLAEGTPKFLAGTGLTSIPTYDQDLAFWLPGIAVAAIWMWRGMAWGRLLVGGALVMWVLEAVGVAVDQWMGAAADPSSTVASASVMPMFAALAVTGMIPLFFFMREVRHGQRW